MKLALLVRGRGKEAGFTKHLGEKFALSSTEWISIFPKARIVSRLCTALGTRAENFKLDETSAASASANAAAIILGQIMNAGSNSHTRRAATALWRELN